MDKLLKILLGLTIIIILQNINWNEKIIDAIIIILLILFSILMIDVYKSLEEIN